MLPLYSRRSTTDHFILRSSALVDYRPRAPAGPTADRRPCPPRPRPGAFAAAAQAGAAARRDELRQPSLPSRSSQAPASHGSSRPGARHTAPGRFDDQARDSVTHRGLQGAAPPSTAPSPHPEPVCRARLPAPPAPCPAQSCLRSSAGANPAAAACWRTRWMIWTIRCADRYTARRGCGFATGAAVVCDAYRRIRPRNPRAARSLRPAPCISAAGLEPPPAAPALRLPQPPRSSRRSRPPFR